MCRQKTLIMYAAAFSFLCIVAFAASGCSLSTAPPQEPAPVGGLDAHAGAASFLVTEFDLDELRSMGLPLILNFGDDSQASLDTLAALEKLQEGLGNLILIRSVDLAQAPQAKEGFPVPVVPSQFFFMADGKPAPLALNIGVLLSVYLSVDTEEPAFSVHEGPLSVEEILEVLEFMGVVDVE